MESNRPMPKEIVAWVERARQGDSAAQNHLFELYKQSVYRLVRRFFHSRPDVDIEAIVAEIFLIAFKHLDQLQDPAKFEVWLYQIAKYKCLSFHRKKARSVVSFEELLLGDEGVPAATLDPEAAHLRKDLIDAIIQAIRSLKPEEQRTAACLRFLEDEEIEEIAKVLGKSRANVYNILTRARKQILANLIDKGYLLPNAAVVQKSAPQTNKVKQP